MKKNFMKKIMCIMLASAMFAMPVLASEGIMKNGTVASGVSIELPTDETQYSICTVDAEGRGTYISTGTVVLSNEGGGKLGVTIETLAHKQCDEIRHVAILEKRNDNGTWSEVKRYEYVALQKNFPTEELTGLTNSFTVKNQTVGKYYRVRGIHNVISNSKTESLTSKTDAILATQYGD